MWTEVLDRLGVEYTLVGDEASAQCPMHRERTGKDDRHPSWSLNVLTGLHNCFGCGYGGNIHRLVTDVLGVDKDGAEEWVREGTASPEVLRRRLGIRRSPTPMVVDEAVLLSMDVPSREMLESRRIDERAAEHFGVRSMDGGWVLPIRDPDNHKLWGWQKKDGKRVRNHPSGVPKSLTLFGRPEGSVVLVESPLDCLLLHRLGVPAVATFGASVSNAQVSLLSRSDSVTLAMDNDEAGRTAHSRLVPALRTLGITTKVVSWDGGGKDFGDYPDEDVLRIVGSAAIPLKGMLK